MGTQWAILCDTENEDIYERLEYLTKCHVFGYNPDVVTIRTRPVARGFYVFDLPNDDTLFAHLFCVAQRLTEEFGEEEFKTFRLLRLTDNCSLMPLFETATVT